jgi:Na+-translocating ferredoxin:NAD+ oxidoreductase RnfA subunit
MTVSFALREALSSLTALAVFSGLSVNLILQCGFSLKEIALAGENAPSSGRNGSPRVPGKKEVFAGLGIIFISVILLWLFFSFTRAVLPLGLFEYILLFPVSCLLFSCLDNLMKTYIFRKTDYKEDRIFGGGVLTSAALFITLNVAGRFPDAAVTTFGFTLGIAIAYYITGEIHRRCAMEAVPGFLRGGPLTLIAMGLLSLVFSSAAMVLYNFLEG